MRDTANHNIKISDLKGDYLLVDFWASWCMPCRAEHPLMVKAYQKYKNNKFQIVSVSIDQLESNKFWLKAIYEDHTDSWIQLSDFEKLAQKTYGI